MPWFIFAALSAMSFPPACRNMCCRRVVGIFGQRMRSVRVAHEHDAGLRVNRLEQRRRKPGIDHAELVDDEQIAGQLVFGVAVEFLCGGVHLEHAVDGAGL